MEYVVVCESELTESEPMNLQDATNKKASWDAACMANHKIVESRGD